MTAPARRLWQRYEVIHDVLYFGPRLREQGDAAGLRGFWMAYFACRAAPVGTAGPDVVTALFYGFHRSRVARALPDAWARVTPEQALAVREAAVDATLRDLVDLADPRWRLAEAADLAWTAAQAAQTAGRPLAAGNQALPRPRQPHLALWQATSVLREHRGDGHNAVLVARGIGPAEAHLLKVGAGESAEQLLRAGRGFPDEEWTQARDRLRERGLLDAGGRLTELGAAEHRDIEAATDAAAAQPLAAIPVERLVELLDPLASMILAAGLLPVPNPVGLVPGHNL